MRRTTTARPNCGEWDLLGAVDRQVRPQQLLRGRRPPAFNRQGEEFDRGETFSSVDYGVGLEVVEELRPLVPPGATLAQLALRWILAFDAVSTVIPGGEDR